VFAAAAVGIAVPRHRAVLRFGNHVDGPLIAGFTAVSHLCITNREQFGEQDGVFVKRLARRALGPGARCFEARQKLVGAIIEPAECVENHIVKIAKREVAGHLNTTPDCGHRAG